MTTEEYNFRSENLKRQIEYYKKNYPESECYEVIDALESRLGEVMRIAWECGL